MRGMRGMTHGIDTDTRAGGGGGGGGNDRTAQLQLMMNIRGNGQEYVSTSLRLLQNALVGPPRSRRPSRRVDVPTD